MFRKFFQWKEFLLSSESDFYDKLFVMILFAIPEMILNILLDLFQFHSDPPFSG